MNEKNLVMVSKLVSWWLAQVFASCIFGFQNCHRSSPGSPRSVPLALIPPGAVGTCSALTPFTDTDNGPLIIGCLGNKHSRPGQLFHPEGILVWRWGHMRACEEELRLGECRNMRRLFCCVWILHCTRAKCDWTLGYFEEGGGLYYACKMQSETRINVSTPLGYQVFC